MSSHVLVEDVAAGEIENATVVLVFGDEPGRKTAMVKNVCLHSTVCGYAMKNCSLPCSYDAFNSVLAPQLWVFFQPVAPSDQP